jgi:hypothetical protein
MEKETVENWWLGEDPSRLLGMTGWVNDTPEEEVAFLLLYALSDGNEIEMSLLAELLGLRKVMPDTDPELTDKVAAVIDGDMIELRPDNGALLGAIPVTGDFTTVTRRGWAVLVVGFDGYSDHPVGLDRYLSRGNRLRWARIAVT